MRNLRQLLKMLMEKMALSPKAGISVQLPEPAIVLKAASPTPWLEFDCDASFYDKWVPHSCGVCALKEVLDVTGISPSMSVAELIRACVRYKAFKEEALGHIAGIYHHPLAQLARDLGLFAQVRRTLTALDVIKALHASFYVVASVQLERWKEGVEGSHLILIYGYDATKSEFLVHDSGGVVSQSGVGSISVQCYSTICNSKGLLLGRVTASQFDAWPTFT